MRARASVNQHVIRAIEASADAQSEEARSLVRSLRLLPVAVEADDMEMLAFRGSRLVAQRILVDAITTTARRKRGRDPSDAVFVDLVSPARPPPSARPPAASPVLLDDDDDDDDDDDECGSLPKAAPRFPSASTQPPSLPRMQAPTAVSLPPSSSASAAQRSSSTSSSVAPRSSSAAVSRAPSESRAPPVQQDVLTTVPLADVRGWQLVLIIDTREVRTRTDRDFVRSKLEPLGLAVDVRQLPLGDFLWVLRPHRLTTSSSSSSSHLSMPVFATDDASCILTDMIVERKRADDLASSIIDGRYEEQKLRLAACPCRRVTYLVEGVLSHQNRLSADALRTSLRTTRIVNGFSVVHTTSIDNTVQWLARTHAILQSTLGADTEGVISVSGRELAAHSLVPAGGITLQGFFDASRKRGLDTVLSVFGAMLRQVPLCSASRAEAILDEWPTPAALCRAVRDEPDIEKRIAELSAARQDRSLGAALAQRLVECFREDARPRAVSGGV